MSVIERGRGQQVGTESSKAAKTASRRVSRRRRYIHIIWRRRSNTALLAKMAGIILATLTRLKETRTTTSSIGCVRGTKNPSYK
jgi:hypothetical protein